MIHEGQHEFYADLFLLLFPVFHLTPLHCVIKHALRNSNHKFMLFSL